MNLVDTNLLVRYFVEDDKNKADAVERLFSSPKSNIFIPNIVIAELVWVLKSFYKQPKRKIVQVIQALLSFKNIKMGRKVVERTLINFQERNVNWIDAYLAALVQIKRYKNLYSYDGDFDKIPGIKRLEP